MAHRIFDAATRRDWRTRCLLDNSSRAKKLNRISAYIGRGFAVPCQLYRGQPSPWHRWIGGAA